MVPIDLGLVFAGIVFLYAWLPLLGLVLAQHGYGALQDQRVVDDIPSSAEMIAVGGGLFGISCRLRSGLWLENQASDIIDGSSSGRQASGCDDHGNGRIADTFQFSGRKAARRGGGRKLYRLVCGNPPSSTGGAANVERSCAVRLCSQLGRNGFHNCMEAAFSPIRGPGCVCVVVGRDIFREEPDTRFSAGVCLSDLCFHLRAKSPDAPLLSIGGSWFHSVCFCGCFARR